MRNPLGLAMMAILAGCAPVTADQDASGAQLASISYSLSPCFGACPVFSVEAERGGDIAYEGQGFVAVKGPRMVTASPAEWQTFAQRLAPFRPTSDTRYDRANCSVPVATDNPSVTITWHDADASSVTLEWYMGCAEPDLAPNRERLYEAWKELPLADLVGSEENRFRCDGL